MTWFPAGAVSAGEVLRPSILDAWATQGSIGIGSPGSRTVSSGSNRLLIAVTSATLSIDPTALTWGGRSFTLQASQDTTSGRDLHSALWTMDEAEIALAAGTSFAVTPNSGSTQFRLVSAAYQDVNQTTPLTDTDQVNATSGANPTSNALATSNPGLAITAVVANRGTSDGEATENVVYSNMTELLEATASNGYISTGTADTDGANFTPGYTLTHGQVGHVLSASLAPT